MSENGQRTPFQIYESILRTLNTSTKRINLIRRDQELLAQGWKIHFAVDPHDINHFCFPFPIESLQSFRAAKIDELSRIQNGRYEVMFNVRTRPVLLQEYEPELDSILSWAQRSQLIVNDDELIDCYLDNVEIAVGDGFDDTRETLTRLAERDVSSIIAIVTGMGSIGFKRMNEIMNRRLLRALPGSPGERRRFKPEHRPAVMSKIGDAFRKYFEENERQAVGYAQSEAHDSLLVRSRNKIISNNNRDARALDHLLQLNNLYTEERQLILYFSSAPKSVELDRSAELRPYLPLVDGEPYEIVRTATDLFIYMIYKGDEEDWQENAAVAAERLSKLASILEDAENIRDRFRTVSEQCQHCNLHESHQPCEFGSVCEGVRMTGEYIEQRQYRNVNLSLHRRLAEALEKTHGQAPQVKYGSILRTISDILSEKNLKRPKEQEMEMVLKVSLNKANFISAYMKKKKRGEYKSVSCYLNYYPICLKVNDPRLRDIVQRVTALLHGDWVEEEFEEVVGDYLKLDAQWNEEPESELVRCFLYIVMDNPKFASRVALNFVGGDAAANETMRREFIYLLCFIAWRETNFNRAVEWATRGSVLDAYDGRFPHCRSMATLSLLETDAKGQPRSFKDVLDDTYASIESFRRDGNAPMVAVCHNNAAYYLSDLGINMIDVERAEHHLQELTKLIPEDSWEPYYPEFFHTKGSVLYSKFISEMAKEQRRDLLHDAYKAAQKAYALHPDKEQHKKLKEDIDSTYRTLKLTVPKNGSA